MLLLKNQKLNVLKVVNRSMYDFFLSCHSIMEPETIIDWGIHVFRRDLRLDDNHGLIKLCKTSKNIIPVFFLDKHQIKIDEHNKYYYSSNAVQFMCESLMDLDRQLRKYNSKLFLFYGEPGRLLAKLIKQLDGNVMVSWNADYSKYALKRDLEMREICTHYKASILETHTDYTLVPFDKLIKSDGNAFKQYGAFFKNAIKTSPTKSSKNRFSNYISSHRKFTHEFDNDLSQFYKPNNLLAQIGGRANTLAQLKKAKDQTKYNDMRDRLDYNTTNISAGLNFGCVSIREVYEYFEKHLGKNTTLIKQLYWRDFYLTAVKYIPFANDMRRHIDERYEKIKWINNKVDWKKIIEGKTGFLLIDAAMNQMKITGFMHNRARMLVVMMWCKYLLIHPFHPKYGSQVSYSCFLVDAIGPSQNQMNHRWCTEFDFPGKKYSAPNAPLSGRPMDISNKMIAKWDPDCIYIKKWLPHLKFISNKDLIKWNIDIAKEHNNIHPPPMFDHREKYKEWINACKGIK